MPKAKFNKRANFKLGDRVRLVSIAKHPTERVNWVRRDGLARYGKDGIVQWVCASGFIYVSGFRLAHPSAKFKLVKSH